ncbi:winged helix-turn-helix domain-containing protein [Marinococcus sp. PL1-022]|uniref:winged helix-turn-helix domain-containing protein n=1 Tax=Marinococcus sp. PL1-022 TaxID=3095363 RepID=UPI0029C2057C|nr:winged helix-turn-helix domain-containing protein [Marinococcus sp. PL1-022]MDX6153997.1 winged helix-turn-helix domain-containing protein [Marinococcus sp. PL1-022]
MLHQLVTSKTRLRLIVKFFLCEEETYLRRIVREFNDSANAIRVELKRLSEMELITGRPVQNRRYYQVNKNHYMYEDMNRLIRNYVQWDQMVELLEETEWQYVYMASEEQPPHGLEYIVEVGESSLDVGKQILLGESMKVTFVTADTICQMGQTLIMVHSLALEKQGARPLPS